MQRRFYLYRRGRIWYAQLYNPTTRKYLSVRSTGETSRNAAAGVVVHWLEEGIPEASRGRRLVNETLNIDTILQTIRCTTLSLGDAERIVRALQERELIETAAIKAGTGTEDFICYLERSRTTTRAPTCGPR